MAVDDHPVVRQGIIGLVSGQPDMKLVAEASNGREAIQQFRTHRPDVTLMDVQMPEMNGVDAIIAICGEFSEARIIVLTTYVGDVQVVRAIKAGARAYLLKNTLHKELLDTIRAVHSGKKTMSPEVSFQLAEHATDDALTPAEISVLRLMRPEMPTNRLPISSWLPKRPSKVESRISSPNWAPTTEPTPPRLG